MQSGNNLGVEGVTAVADALQKTVQLEELEMVRAVDGLGFSYFYVYVSMQGIL
jgi:hypothetical protein